MDLGSQPENELEWCQIKETLTMLYLSSAQIETSMHENDEVFQQLSDAMISIADSSHKIGKLLTLDSIGESNASLAGLKDSAAKINEQVGLSVTACQFHDRNTQKLQHVTAALSKVCEIISSPERFSSKDDWDNLQTEIKESYTMETERIMFEHIMMGASVEEALEIYHHNFNDEVPEDDTGDDIELF